MSKKKRARVKKPAKPAKPASNYDRVSRAYDRMYMRKETSAKLRRLAEIEARTMSAVLDRLIGEALDAAEAAAK